MTGGATVLVVDDEDACIRSLQPTLEGRGYRVAVARNASEARVGLRDHKPDVVLLDLGLPDGDGKDLIREIREAGQMPIIVVSARGLEEERIASLDLGANDFIAKPYSAGELLARLRACLRSTGIVLTHTFERNEFSLNFSERILRIKRARFRLSKKETDLLRTLTGAKGNIVSPKRIIAEVWGPNGTADTQHVRVLVMQLRQKLATDREAAQLVVSESGLGYRLRLPHDDW